MYSLFYQPGIPGTDPINLSGTRYSVGKATGLRSSAWTYTLMAAGLSGVTASAREATLTVQDRTPELFDRTGMIFGAEIALGKPCTLIVDGQWSQRCYVTKAATTSASRIADSPRTQAWTVVLLDGVRIWVQGTEYGGIVNHVTDAVTRVASTLILLTGIRSAEACGLDAADVHAVERPWSHVRRKGR